MYVPHVNDEKSWLYWYQYIYYPTYNRLDGLLAGVTIAALSVFLPQLFHKITRYGNLLLVMGLTIMVTAYFLCENQQTFNASIFGFPLIALGFGSMVLGAISPTSFLYTWNSKITTFIATQSYAIYLTHKGVIHTTHLILQDFKINTNLMLLICIFTCISFAYLLHITVEKPFLKWRNKRMVIQ